MNWNMPAASSVRFLAVRGTIWVGDCHTTYDFTLVEYHLHIDEVPWTIFSTLADVLENEFDPAFWKTVNYNRKERWGFLEPPWDGKAYGAAPPYVQLRLSIFNRDAHTMRVVQPFVWNHTHLKVHPNGAMIYHDQKRLAYLLPLIVEAHDLLPPKPLFWTNEDKTIPLERTTLWTHDETIQWLAETGGTYPQELRDELQPRIDQLKSSQRGKRALPPPPPLPNRWTERSAATQPVPKLNAEAPQDPKTTQSTPQQVADREWQYMELQSIIHQANQQTLADSRPTAARQAQKPANLLAASQQSTDNAATAASSNPSTGVGAQAAIPQQKPPDKISAQSLFHQRPGPPSALPANKAQTDTPGTGVLSSDSHSATHSKDDEQQQPPEQLAAHDDTSTEETSPANTPKASPETQATDTAGASSPEPVSESVQDVDLAAADIPTLESMEKTACERVASYESRLHNAREHLTRIRKRLKRMRDGHSPGTLRPSPVADMEMEIID